MNRTAFFGVFLMFTCLLMIANPAAAGSNDGVHPDHSAPFHEQLSGQWAIDDGGKDARRFRFYEDGRFAFLGDGDWTAGSFFILRSDERSKGVLRLEYYLDGNLHFQEVLVEIHFEAHSDHAEEQDHHHGHDHDHGESSSKDHDHGEEEGGHHHEMLLVKTLPAAERALAVDGDYEHVH